MARMRTETETANSTVKMRITTGDSYISEGSGKFICIDYARCASVLCCDGSPLCVGKHTLKCVYLIQPTENPESNGKEAKIIG